MIFSAAYFEVAFGMVNHFFPQGYTEDRLKKIPNQNFASYLYPKFLFYGGHISLWLQYFLILPVFFQFGWIVALIYLVFPLFGTKMLAMLLWQSNFAKSFTLELMYVTLERRIKRKDFKVDNGTDLGGEQFFEELFKEILVFIDSLPARKNAGS